MGLDDTLLTPAQAAKLKQVSRTAIYMAVAEGRLAHTRVLGHIALRKADVLAWTPIRYAGRPGPPSGPRPGSTVSDETKKRISVSQKQRWQKMNKTRGKSSQ